MLLRIPPFFRIDHRTLHPGLIFCRTDHRRANLAIDHFRTNLSHMDFLCTAVSEVSFSVTKSGACNFEVSDVANYPLHLACRAC
jgi:hypothetical protein